MTNFLNTDREIERYNEAELYAETATPDMIKGIRSSFNTDTGQTDLMAPLPSGGFVRLASQAPDIMVEAPAMPGQGADAPLPVEDDEFQLQSIRNYAASGANISSRDDYLAAGYTDEQIDASGVMGETQQKTDRTEPLSVREIETILREGGTLFSDYTPTMRENGSADLMETLMEISVDRRREELMAQGVDTAEISRIITSERPEMRSLAENLTDVVFGNKNVLGTGIADFVTAGVMDMQEGYRMLEAGSSFNGGSATQRGLGILLIAAGVAEATGVGFALGKLIKASIPKIQGAMVSMGQNAELRMAERGPAVDFLANTMMSGVDPTIVTDPLVAAAGRAVTPALRLGPASDQEMFGQLAQPYRVTVEGFTPTGTGKQSMIPRKMTPGNFQATTIKLDELAQQFPDPLASDETYATMVATMQNVGEVSAPPRWMVEHANNIEQWADWFKGLTPDQIKAADEGLAVQKNFQDAYAAGAGPELTGQLMLWSILSRMLSAFPHEGGYIDLAEAATPFIQKAAAGNWSDADTAAWLEMVPNAIPEGAPGKSATSNANDFGKVFLKKMAAVDENGVSALTRLHEMVADPTKSSAEIRRAYYGLASDTGIANKILSFALLVSGRNDVVVLDRIQINRMWAGGDKVYDDIMKQFEGAQGLAQYEALERSLASKVGSMYEAAGRGDIGSVGRYHWESWVLSSGQIVAHPTLEGVVRAGAPDASAKIPPTASTPVSEGRFHRKYYGVTYEKLPSGGNRLVYKTSTGDPYQFTKPQLDDMFKEAFNKKSGVLPEDFPGVGAFEGGSIPWFEYEGVDRGKLDELIRQAGKPADN